MAGHMKPSWIARLSWGIGMAFRRAKPKLREGAKCAVLALQTTSR